MSRDERRWCVGASLAVMLLTSIPYLIGFQAGRPGWVFTGFVFGVGDGNSYIAKMLQGAAGAWLFRTPYSSLDVPGVLAFLPYLLLGKLAAGQELHAQLVILFHLARLASIPLLVFAVYRFSALFLPESTWRRWATALTILGGGLGWLLALSGHGQAFGSLPLDLISPESFGFLAVYGLPHLVLARALIFFALTTYLTPGSGWRSGVWAGLLLAALVLVQPLAVLSAYAALACHVFVLLVLEAAGRQGESVGPWARKAAITALIPLPLVVYYAYGAFFVPALQQWAAQNILPSPPPVHYLLAYALILAPAVVGARDLIRSDAAGGWFLVAWIAALFLLAYAPVTVQRRLIEGAWVALSVLAARGLRSVPIGAARRRWLAAGLLAASMLTSVLLLAGGAWEAIHPSVPLYRPASETAAFHWIADHARPGSIVLATFDTANALPAWAPVRSVTGHGPETAHLAQIEPQVEAFFGGSLVGVAAERFLDDQRVDLVLRGPAQDEGASWDGLPSARLSPVYDHDGYVIYSVARKE